MLFKKPVHAWSSADHDKFSTRVVWTLIASVWLYSMVNLYPTVWFWASAGLIGLLVVMVTVSQAIRRREARRLQRLNDPLVRQGKRGAQAKPRHA